MSKRVVIVGGGLSGLAAGVTLVSRGIHVTILEQKPALGGRAYSFKDNITGDTIDNGQHVLIAGYERTIHFLETIGTRHLLKTQHSPALIFHHPKRGFRKFSLPLLPTPFNLLIGILRCSLFSLLDRFKLLRAGIALRSLDPSREKYLATQTIEQWLRDVGQSGECIRSFWEPIAISMMNEHIEQASALVFVKALRTAFLGGSRNSALAIPTVGLSQLYVDGAKQFITLRGGEIHCNADVVELMMTGDSVAAVKLRNGEVLNADAFILAVPPHKLLSILPARLQERFSKLNALQVAPIVSIHLWFANEFMNHELVGVIGKRIQWLFNRRKISSEQGKGSHVSAVISGAYEFVDKSKDDLVKIAVDDIRSVYPYLQDEPTHAVVVREKSATYASSPMAETLRPSNETEISNVCIAGDWTFTGYPATIEGAIVSAENAARLIGNFLC